MFSIRSPVPHMERNFRYRSRSGRAVSARLPIPSCPRYRRTTRLESTSPAPKTIKATPPSMYKVSRSVVNSVECPFVGVINCVATVISSRHLRLRPSTLRLLPRTIQDPANHAVDHPDGFIQRTLNSAAQSHLAFFSAQGLRFATHHQQAVQWCIHGLRHPNHVHWVHAVRIDPRLHSRSAILIEVGFNDEDGSRRLPLGTGIDQDHGFVSVMQRVNEIEAANAKVGDADLFRKRHCCES